MRRGAIFDPLQVAQSLKELNLLRRELVDVNVINSLEALADIEQVVLKLPHRELVFMGD